MIIYKERLKFQQVAEADRPENGPALSFPVDAENEIMRRGMPHGLFLRIMYIGRKIGWALSKRILYTASPVTAGNSL